MTGVAVVPAKGFGGSQAQVEGLVVSAVHQEDLRAVGKELRNFGLGRCAGRENYRAQTRAGSHAGSSRASVACGGSHNNLLVYHFHAGGDQSARAVFEGSAGIAAFVLYPELSQA